MRRLAADDGAGCAAEVRGVPFVHAADVGPWRIHAFLERRLEAPLLQPLGRLRPAPGAIDHQVRGQRLRRPLDANAGDAAGGGVVHRRLDGNAIADREVGERAHAVAHRAFEQRPAGDHAGEVAVRPRHVAATETPDDVGHDVAAKAAARHDLVGQAGEVLLQHAGSADEEAVCVPPLRDALAVLRFHRQRVAFDDGDAREVAREDARSEQPGHARAHDDRVFPC
ncbi:MAG: hypothetical protein IPG47_16615 [Thermoflexaceae bacterium]|nr:hypothetical protein [Thermoflexaceae bacterium]